MPLPSGEELSILKRDKAGRVIRITFKSSPQDTIKTYNLKYDWEGNTTEVAEGDRKMIMKYKINSTKKNKTTSIYIPLNKNKTPISTISHKIIELIFPTAHATPPPSETSITGVSNNTSRISTLLEFSSIDKKVQRADSATLQSYLPFSVRPSTSVTNPQCSSRKAKCAKIKEGLKYAKLSTCVYNIEKCITRSKPRNEWKRMTAQDLRIPPELLNDGDYHAEVLYNGKEYVLVFEGTADAGDWKDNVGQGGLGLTTAQYEKAIRLARLLKDKLPDFTIAGHSLGGGLATAAALASGKKAVVFNLASLHPKFMKDNNLEASKANQLITSYHVNGEILTTVQDSFNKPALGNRVTLEPDIDYLSGHASSIDLHGMDAVNNTLLYQQQALGCNSSPL